MSRRPRRREEITPLNGMRRTCTAMKTAKAKNNAFVAQRRNDVRTLLRLAYVQRQLPHTGSATLTAFGAAAEQEPAEDTDSDFEMLTETDVGFR